MLSDQHLTRLEDEIGSIASAIECSLQSPNVSDRNGEAANVVDALDELASAIRFAAKHLGFNDASTPMGAIEGLGKCITDGADTIADAMHCIADAIREHGGT